jgi:hypothetical protein
MRMEWKQYSQETKERKKKTVDNKQPFMNAAFCYLLVRFITAV